MNTKLRTNNNTTPAKVGPWTAPENAALVCAYMDMLACQRNGSPYSKAAIRRALIGTPDLPGPLAFRSHASIECKFMNVSGCMKALGRHWVAGYVPLMSYQSSLMAAVCTYLNITTTTN